jgi:hypothetical protein
VTDLDYDTEFLEDGRTVDLISIAIVAEDGEFFYGINEDMPLGPISRHKWLMTHVMPSLPLTSGPYGPWDGDHPDIQFVMPYEEIAEGARKFITRYTDPCLWADHGAYDHVALAQLFGTMMDLPHGVPMWTADIQQEIRRLGNPRVPVQMAGAHNALQDAWHLQKVRQFLRGYEQNYVINYVKGLQG